MNITKTKIIALGSTAALGVGIAISAASGAYFSASEPMPVSGNTATLSVEVNGAASDATGITFKNIAPGKKLTQSFTVKNTGTVAADVEIGAPISVSGVHGHVSSMAELGQLSAGIVGYGGLKAITGYSGTSTIDLGTLQPNQTRTYTAEVLLDQNAGNDWQGATASGTVTVTLNQAH